MASPIYPVGSRVRVLCDQLHGGYPWPSEPTGTVLEDPDGRPFTLTTTVRGPARTYWVEFDEPQFDTEGDGPYPRSQVLDVYLELLDDGPGEAH